jgi:hypothetical protein
MTKVTIHYKSGMIEEYYDVTDCGETGSCFYIQQKDRQLHIPLAGVSKLIVAL